MPVLADVSKNGIPYSSANFYPSCVRTTRSLESDLFPTNILHTFSWACSLIYRAQFSILMHIKIDLRTSRRIPYHQRRRWEWYHVHPYNKSKLLSGIVPNLQCPISVTSLFYHLYPQILIWNQCLSVKYITILPIVVKWLFVNIFSQNLINKHVLPTPESPIINNLTYMLNYKSYKFIIIVLLVRHYIFNLNVCIKTKFQC